MCRGNAMQKYFFVFLIFASILFSYNQQNINKFLEHIKEESFKSASIYNDKNISSLFKKDMVENKLIPTIFYFYTQSLGVTSIKNFAYNVLKLKRKFKNIRAYVVFRGFPKREFLIKLREQVYNPKLEEVFIIKVHPFIYRYYHLDEVPAYAFIYCPKDFRFDKCKKNSSLLAKGDFSLQFFFKLLSDYNEKKFGKYYKVYEGIDDE